MMQRYSLNTILSMHDIAFIKNALVILQSTRSPFVLVHSSSSVRWYIAVNQRDADQTQPTETVKMTSLQTSRVIIIFQQNAL